MALAGRASKFERWSSIADFTGQRKLSSLRLKRPFPLAFSYLRFESAQSICERIV